MRILGAVATEPGVALTGAHVLLSAAAGGAALAVALTSFSGTIALNLARETGLAEKIPVPALRRLLTGQNAPVRLAALGLIGVAGLSFVHGLPLLGAAFFCFAGGNMLFGREFSRKIPLDNVLYTVGSCTTAYIAGGSFLPWLALVPGGILSCYNVMKPAGDRNLGKPKLWFAGSQLASAALGLFSGRPERLLPALGMVSVTWGYTMMEARISGWLGNGGNPLPASEGNTNPQKQETPFMPGAAEPVRRSPAMGPAAAPARLGDEFAGPAAESGSVRVDERNAGRFSPAAVFSETPAITPS